MKKILILGSSSGIGKEILKDLRKLNYKIFNPDSKILDTSNINSVLNYCAKIKSVDCLILNTGGPPAKNFFNISIDDWQKYFVQLFLGKVLILQNLKVKKNGYIFLISSHTIKNPENKLVLSNAFRVATTSVFKTLSKLYSNKNISCINIAPGPFKTRRLKQLVGKKNFLEFEKNLPMGKAGNPKDISKFIFSIIKLNIKYINGTTITFDGGLSTNIF